MARPMTDAQRWRYEALKLVLENMPDRVKMQPFKKADEIAEYLRGKAGFQTNDGKSAAKGGK